MFKKLFGSSSTPAVKPPSQSNVNKTIDSIQSLQEHEDQLEKRKALLEKKIEAELQKARELNKAGKKASSAISYISKINPHAYEMTTFFPASLTLSPLTACSPSMLEEEEAI